MSFTNCLDNNPNKVLYNVDFANVEVVTINHMPYPPPFGPDIGIGATGDIVTYTGHTGAPFLQDSNVNIDTSQNITNVQSIRGKGFFEISNPSGDLFLFCGATGSSLLLEDNSENNIILGATSGLSLESGPGLPLIFNSNGGNVVFNIAGFLGAPGQVVTNYNGTNCNWANPSGVNTFVDFTSITNHNVIVVAQQNIKYYNFQPATSYTITLPLITGSMLGYMIYIMTGDGSLNANSDSLAITPTVPNTIDGNTHLTLTGSGSAAYGFDVAVSIIQIYCDGTQWISNIPSAIA
jgi:hypothetical protein